MHIAKNYDDGVGHIEARDGHFLVSAYFQSPKSRVVQASARTLADARYTLRAIFAQGV